MGVRLRKYKPEQDFLRIRNFLVNTYRAFGMPLNWRLERWNYARYFVAPFLGAYGQKDPNLEDSLRAIRFWEEITGVWESEDSEILGVVNIEHPDRDHPGFGEAFLQRHPQSSFLLAEMLDYAEKMLINRKTNALHIYVYDDDEALQALVQERGYERDAERARYDSELVIGKLPEQKLPEGYRIQSMAQKNDIEAKREVFGRAFNHIDPAEWPSSFSYEELQRAPDYRKELDLSVISPEGKHIAGCITWYDGLNKMAVLEPVGTHPDFRGLGLGREVVFEGIRRAAALGAETVQVGSGQRFYEQIGFQKKWVSYRWAKKF